MRLKQLSYAAAIMSLGAVLGACSSESMVPEPDVPVDKDTDFYINVKIASPAEQTTRTDPNTVDTNYDNGSGEEQKIHEILFVFYNSDNQYVGNKTVDVTETPAAEDKEGSVETILDVVVPVTVAAGSTKPASVMAYVNPTLQAKSDLLNDYNTAIGAFRTLGEVVPGTGTGDNVHKGFSMNNSVHYEAEAADELPTIAIGITEDQLKTSATEAATADPVVIYVERIVAKVAMEKIAPAADKITGNAGNDAVNTASTSYVLNFDVKGWGLSNLEQATFLVKNFREDKYGNPTSFGSPMVFKNYTYGTLEGRLNDPTKADRSMNNPSWNFNAGTPQDGTNWGISGHRSFWALSPTYYHDDDTTFPSCADDIYDGTSVDQTKSPLIYRSFNDIYNINRKVAGQYGVGNDAKHAQYTLEHTMQAGMVTDYQKRAVTCAVVVGQYSLTKTEKAEDGTTTTSTLTYDKDNFYISKAIVDGKATSLIYASDTEMQAAYLKANSTIFKKVGDDFVKITADDMGDFEIAHPRKEITGGSSVPSRYVTLMLKKENVGTNKYYYPVTVDGAVTYAPITEDNLTSANSDLYTNLIGMLGGIEMYKNGYAYFEIPVRHLWGRDNKNIGEKDFSAQVGQYGIVRNHSYTLNVTGIDGIGIGISDPDAPIIPNIENDNYAVRTEIRVQRWRVVPTQNVTLKP